MTVAQRAAVVASLALLALPSAAGAAPGDLDPGFGGDGVVTASPGDRATLSALALEGSTVVGAGGVDSGWCDQAAVARWNASGTLLGVAAPSLGGPCTEDDRYGATADALALTPGGGALTGGSRTRFAPHFGATGLLTAQTPAGAFDDSFSDDGWVDEGFDGAGITALVRLPDGRVVAGGNRYGIGRFNWEVRRYLPGGDADDAFGGDGGVVYPWAVDGHVDTLSALVTDGDDGSVVAAGTAARHEDGGRVHLDGATIGRIQPDGTLDPGFGAGGRTRVEPPGEETNARDVLRTPDGGFLVTGAAWPAGGSFETDGRWLLLKFGADGQLDDTFGAGGRVDGPGGWAAALALDSHERIVVLGRTAGGEIAVGRYLLNGAVDESFGTGGVARPGVDFWPEDVVVQPDDRVVAGGTGGDAMVLVRLLADGRDDDDDTTPPDGPDDEGEASGDGAIVPTEDGAIVDSGPIPNRQAAGPGVSIRILSSRVNRRGVLVRVTWPRGTEGTARARLWTRDRGVRLGQRRVAVLRGTTSRRFRIPLNRRAKRMLKGGRRLKVRATVRVTGLPARR